MIGGGGQAFEFMRVRDTDLRARIREGWRPIRAIVGGTWVNFLLKREVAMHEETSERARTGEINMKKSRGSVGENIAADRADWRFDKPGVAENFDDHVSKSVPFYDEVQLSVGELSDWFIDRDSNVFDIGCSTGTTLAALASRHQGKGVHFTGIDEVEPMLAQAGGKLAKYTNIHLIRDTIPSREAHIRDASFVTSLWALQFCRKKDRGDFVAQVYEGLIPGGAFVLVEKILGSDPVTNGIFVELYHNFKKHQGYTLDQIESKAHSLRGVLVPDSADENSERLHSAGFRVVDQFFQWLNFAGWVAIK